MDFSTKLSIDFKALKSQDFVFALALTIIQDILMDINWCQREKTKLWREFSEYWGFSWGHQLIYFIYHIHILFTENISPYSPYLFLSVLVSGQFGVVQFVQLYILYLAGTKYHLLATFDLTKCSPAQLNFDSWHDKIERFSQISAKNNLRCEIRVMALWMRKYDTHSKWL